MTIITKWTQEKQRLQLPIDKTAIVHREIAGHWGN